MPPNKQDHLISALNNTRVLNTESAPRLTTWIPKTHLPNVLPKNAVGPNSMLNGTKAVTKKLNTVPTEGGKR